MKKFVGLSIVFMLLFTNISYAGGWFSGASDWAIAELEDAVENGIITYNDFVDEIGGYSNNITREQFAELIMRMYFEMTGDYPEPASFDTFNDTDNTYVFMANAVGIIYGKGDSTFAPNDTITRQEMAVMMSRALDSMNVDYDKGDGVLTIADKGSVASWAVSGVDFAFDNGFIKGDGTNFKPLDNTPIEQAVIIVNRVFEKYNGAAKEPNDYTKGYDISTLGGELTVTFENNGNTTVLATQVKKVYEADNHTLYYNTYSNGIYRYQFSDNNSVRISTLGSPSDFVYVESGKYEGYFIASVYGEFKVYDSSYDYVGNVTSMRDPNYQIGEMYDEQVTEAYQFAITVTDPSQNMTNAKFTEDDMYFYSYANHYDYIDNNVGYLRLYPYNYDGNDYVGPMGRVGDVDRQWVFNGYGGIYETDITFNSNEGNAGIVFNLRYAAHGNDNYAGYYAGIDVDNNKVILGKAKYGVWEKIKYVELGYDVKNGDTSTLKVMKNGTEIKVYVDDKLYITANDDTYQEDGGFGIRTYKADATYSNYTINPLPF